LRGTSRTGTMDVMDALTSAEPKFVLARVLGFGLFWICVRLFASNTLFKHNAELKVRINQGTKTVIVIHSAFQAICAIWLVCYDPVIAPLLRQVARRPASLDLTNVNSPGVSLLATIAAGEFGAQMLHLRWWYEKPSDMLMVAHHTLSAIIWPIAVTSCRSQFFVANMLFYELSTPFMGLLHFNKDNKTAYAVFGTLFTLMFVLARLCTIPITLYCFYLTWDTWTTPPPAGHPSVLPVGSGVLLTEKIAVPLPILLNLFWGRLVVSGYLKALTKSRGKPKEDPKKA